VYWTQDTVFGNDSHTDRGMSIPDKFPWPAIIVLYICANPFIYAVKFDPVRRVLVGLIPWKKTAAEPAVIQMT